MLFLLALQELEEKDRELVEGLYLKYSKRVKVMAVKILGNYDYADDVVNDTFLKVIKYKSKFMDLSEEDSVKLIITMTHNVCFNFLKRKKKIKFSSIDSFFKDENRESAKFDIADDTNILELIVQGETMEYFKTVIDSFKSPAREVLTLRYFYEMRNKEIAEFCDMNLSTVNSIISRGTKKLRKSLEGYVYESNK